MKSRERKAIDGARDSDLAGAEAALGRAARRARQRAQPAVTVAEQRQSTEQPGDADGVETGRDPRELTFSQAHGYEALPGPLKLGELPREARTRIWDVFYSHLDGSKTTNDPLAAYVENPLWVLSGVWGEILREKHIWPDNLPLDEWSTNFKRICGDLRRQIETIPFHQVFDLIQFVLRHSQCPREFTSDMKQAFSSGRLAYGIDEGHPPTILPAATGEEGKTVMESLKTLREAGLQSSAAHLRRACEYINESDWAGSIRESIHAVESVARQIAPEKTDTLTQALKSIDKRKGLHSDLKDGLTRLYWYTSDEQGVRHALLDREKANVGMDEAVFMLGACASFAGYLWRKHTAGVSN